MGKSDIMEEKNYNHQYQKRQQGKKSDDIIEKRLIRMLSLQQYQIIEEELSKETAREFIETMLKSMQTQQKI